MSVESLLALYTTYYGWLLHNILWEIFVHTGIIFLPLIGILVSSYIDTATSQEAREASTTSLRQVEVNMVIAFIVLILGGFPTMVLEVKKLHYIDFCGHQAIRGAKGKVEKIKFGKTKTGLDKIYRTAMFINGEYVKVPLFFYSIMSLSGSINAMVKTKLPCANLKADITSVRNHIIKDDTLRWELARFKMECHGRAQAKFDRYIKSQFKGGDLAPWEYNYSQTQEEYINRVRLVYQHKKAVRQRNYLGNVAYLSYDFLYPALRAKNSVYGFKAKGRYSKRYGRTLNDQEHYDPSCYEWWMDKNQGLFDRIKKYAQKQSDLIAKATRADLTVNSKLSDTVNNIVITGVKLTNYSWLVNELAHSTNLFAFNLGTFQTSTFANRVSSNSIHDFNASPYLANTESGWRAGAGPKILSDVSKWFQNYSTEATVFIYREMFPVVIAFALLAVYFLIPIPVLLSKYAIGILMGIGLLIFSLIFMDSVFHVALWVDDMFYRTFYSYNDWNSLVRPDQSYLNVNSLENQLWSKRPAASEHKAIDIASKMLVFGIPVFYSIMMAIGGYKFVKGVDGFMTSVAGNYASSAGSRVGNAAANIAGSLASSVFKSISSPFKQMARGGNKRYEQLTNKNKK